MALGEWAVALSDVPQEAIEQAVREWVRNEETRPTPAHIRKRALARVVQLAATARRPIAERIADAKRWLAKHGDVPTWLADNDVATALIEEGVPADKLRRAGFSIPPALTAIEGGRR